MVKPPLSYEEHELMLGKADAADVAGQEKQENEEMVCGYWICKGGSCQKFANQKMYVFLFGILGCLHGACFAYFNGTISTVEKRFGIPSKVTGIITTGNDVSQLFVSAFVTYYASRKHQPRWIGFGSYSIVLFCLLSSLPHFIYGPGNESLLLTNEYIANEGASSNITIEASEDRNSVCNAESRNCSPTSDHLVTPLILFVAQFISGLGSSIYHSLGISYMDDNTERAKTPLLLSYSYFIRGLGPVFGYLVCSVCLKMYIAPTLTPTIGNNDPRWLGAWWLGWLLLGSLIFLCSTLVTCFPRVLPKKGNAVTHAQSEKVQNLPTSFSDMVETFTRLFTNKVLMYNNLAAVFFLLGAMPFFIFLPKYMEVIYVQSASFTNFITGAVGLPFSAVGIFLSGVILTKYKPRARIMAAWNVFIGVTVVLAIISFGFLKCPDSVYVHANIQFSTGLQCNKNCNCDYVKYTPVCSEDNRTNFISPCHAGCKTMNNNGSKLYENCECINANYPFEMSSTERNLTSSSFKPGKAIPGICPTDCRSAFTIFLAVLCFMKLIGATGRTTNFLVGVRCVDEKDKSVAMGLGLTIISLAGFIPSPILFGYIIDKSCLVWGKTCSSKGHCWIYDSTMLRHSMSFTSAFFIAIGVIFDVVVWYYVKNVQMFDEEVKNPKEIQKNNTIQ